MKSNYSTRSRQRGFTLYEFLITMAVLGVLITIGIPTMRGSAERRNTISATEEIYSQLQFARSEAVSRSAQVFFNIVDGADWAIGISTNAGCDPSDNNPACVLPDVNGANEVTVLFSSDDFSEISIASTVAQITFSPERATATAATINVTSTDDIGYLMRIDVGVLGQISVCSPDAVPTTYVGGYRAC